MFDLSREISQTLRRNRIRTFLTGIAVAWGIFMLIVLLGMSQGLVNGVNKNMDGDRAQSITVYPGVTSEAYKGYREGRSISLDHKDLGRIHDANPSSVRQVIAYLSDASVTIESGNEFVSDGINGVYPNQATFDRTELVGGRFINQADMDHRRKVMVLSRENARVLFGDEEAALGKHVKSLGLAWTVVGVYSNEWRRDAYVPYTTLALLKGASLNPDNLVVILNDPKDVEDARASEDVIRNTLSKAHQFAPDDASALYTWNRFADFENQQQVMGILGIAVWVIGLLTLLSGVVGVSNIMLVSVSERTHEIGIRRAIGAKPRAILTQIVAESVAITALFGYLGAFFGIVVTEILALLFAATDFIRPTVDIAIAIRVTLLLIIVGVLAGLYPAMKATRVRPVEALRDE